VKNALLTHRAEQQAPKATETRAADNQQIGARGLIQAHDGAAGVT
jgi:hypothetical protein